MKAVVFGGSGFLGGHVADALSDKGYEVTIFDLKESSYARENQRVVLGDILNSASVSKAIEGADYVYHFAGLADLDDATTRPLETVQKNIMGTVTILEAAAQADIKRFVYASTIYVYSQLGGFYRCSKQAGELYVEEYQKRYGLEYTILRYGTLYGPRSDSRNTLYRYLKQGLVEGKINFIGSESDVREYIHVRDAARLSAEILSDAYRNQHIIITGHHPMKVTELLDMVREILNREVVIEYGSVPRNSHYTLTPYSFIPKIGNKLVSSSYVDMGQGLLECLHEIYSSVNAAGESSQSVPGAGSSGPEK